jgi:serine/threonine-protein kinase
VLRPKAQADDLIGEIIADRYHVIRKIGQGGMGAVYLAEHVRMGRRCAIKVMKRSLSQDVGAVSRFAREAANASRINDDNVAHIYDFGETKEHGIYIAMEYVEGETLSKLISREGSLPPARVIGIAIQIANGLAAAHNEGVIHRDLTPSNIIIGQGREQSELVKVVDFGIAKTMHDVSGPTRTGFIVGTPQYMSPEQIIADPLDGRSDIYSLGCILYEMLVGTQPFGAFAGPEQLTRRLTEAPPRPRARVSDLPQVIDAVVVKAMARVPAERFQSAIEFRDALVAAAAEAEKSARRFSWLRRKPGGSTQDVARGGSPLTPAAGTPASTPRSIPPQSSPGRTKPGTAEPSPRVGTPHTPTPAQSGPRTKPTTARTQAPVAPVAGSMERGSSSGATSNPTSTPPSWADPPAADMVSVDDVAVATTPRRGNRLWLSAGALVVVLAGITFGVWQGIDRPSPSPPIVNEPEDRTPGEVEPPVVVADNTESSQAVATKADSVVTPPARVEVPEQPEPTRPRPGTLRLGSLPSGAIIQVDGRRVTPASNTIELAPGNHTIEITGVGFVPARRNLVVAEGQQLSWTPVLAPIPVAPPVERPESTPVRTPPRDSTAGPAGPGVPRTFDESARLQVNSFAQAIERRNLDPIRARTTAQLAADIQTWLDQAGTSPVRVAVRAIAPDSANLKASFYLRIIAGSRDILPFTEFQASFVQMPAGWRLVTIDRR